MKTRLSPLILVTGGVLFLGAAPATAQEINNWPCTTPVIEAGGSLNFQDCDFTQPDDLVAPAVASPTTTTPDPCSPRTMSTLFFYDAGYSAGRGAYDAASNATDEAESGIAESLGSILN